VAKKRTAAVQSDDDDESDDSNVGDPDDESAEPLINEEPATDDVSCRPSRKSKKLWSAEEMANLRKNFRMLEHIDDSILARLTFKEISAVASKREKNGKILTEKLAENYERVRSFAVDVPAGKDYCTGTVHEARFLRGYVGNSQEIWLQARRKMGLAGLDPISNYETVSVGLNGLLSGRVWHEAHSPSSKLLSVRMLTASAMKTAWLGPDKPAEVKEFASVQELKMAVVALDGCIRKIMPWNAAFATLAIFLHTVNFGEAELSGKENRLVFLADFIDEVIRFNAQAWDEERHFMSAQDLAAKWAAAFLRQSSDRPRKDGGGGGNGSGGGQKRAEKTKTGKSGSKTDRVPAQTCKLYQTGECTHTGDRHSASWDPEYVLRHQCAQWLPEKKRHCYKAHPKKDHK
jgi:hypothetical protein